MRLYFIRHGQSVNNLLWTETQSDKGRSHDPELTPIGHAQAQCAAAFMRDELAARLPFGGQWNENARPQVLYTSLMTRAIETGRPIARALNVPLIALADAHEMGGLYLQDETTGEKRGVPGPTRSHFAEHYPELELPSHVNEEGWWNRPFEELEQLPARAERIWNILLEHHGDTDDVIGLITHGGIYNYILAHLLHLSSREHIWFTINNCAISRIEWTSRGLSLVYLNRIDYLPPDLITI